MSTSRQQPVYVEISSNYTLLDSLLYGQLPVEEIRIVADTSGGPLTVTLPNSANIGGALVPKILILDSGSAGTNPITIARSGADRINGNTSMQITTNGGRVQIEQYAVGNWGAVFITNGTPLGTFNSNLIYVDATYGDNTTALPYRIDKAFATIAAAESIAQSGDTILVYPGTYTDAGLGKDGVNYYFYEGAIQQSATTCFTDAGEGTLNVNIDGQGQFISTAGIAFQFEEGSGVNITAKSIEGATGAISIDLEATMNVHLSGDLYATAGNAVLMNGAGGKLWIKCNTIYATATAVGLIGDSTSLVYINCTQIFSTGNAADAIAINNVGATAYITADVVSKTQATADVAVVQIHGAAPAGTYMKLVANITNGAAGRGYILANGSLEMHGNVSGGCTCLVTGTDSSHYHYGNVTANAEARAAITMTGGTMYYSGRITNLHNSVGAHGVTKSSGIFIVAADTVIVLTAAGGESLTGTAGQTFKSYPGCTSNRAVNGGITEQVSTITVSADVV